MKKNGAPRGRQRATDRVRMTENSNLLLLLPGDKIKLWVNAGHRLGQQAGSIIQIAESDNFNGSVPIAIGNAYRSSGHSRAGDLERALLFILLLHRVYIPQYNLKI